MYPFYRKSDKEDAEEKMEMLGIADLKKRCYRDLSGGQQQRVLLARALCATGKLLLLDEPVTGLDPIMTGELYHIFKDCIEKYGVTVIMVPTISAAHWDRQTVFSTCPAGHSSSSGRRKSISEAPWGRDLQEAGYDGYLY